MKKKLLLLASTFPRWKNDFTASFIFELSLKLSASFEVYVLAPHFAGAKKYEEIEGLKIYRFRYFWPESLQKLCYGGGILPNLKNNKFLFIQVFTLVVCEAISAIMIIKREKINLIHAFWLFPQGFVAMFLKNILNIKYIVTSLGGDMFPFITHNKFLLWWYKKILTNAYYVTAVNNAFVTELKELKKQNVFYIPNGVNTQILKPMENVKKNRNILFVGRLAEKKGLQYLIDALPLISPGLYNKLLIVGDGPLRNKLEDKVNNLNLTGKVTFLGSKPYSELPQIYNSSMMLVVPSIITKEGDREGLPTVYLDAMACGCPIITTDIDGIESIIHNNINGIIVPKMDTKALATAIISLLKSSKIRTLISNKAQEDVRRKYDWEVVSKQYIKLYSSL